MFKRVVLPDPLAPTIAVNYPALNIPLRLLTSFLSTQVFLDKKQQL
jgi:hypothetical protein